MTILCIAKGGFIMIECKKCGYSNKHHGKCKNCGLLNIPEYSVSEIISNMSSGQKCFALFIVIIYICYALIAIIELLKLKETYFSMAETGDFNERFLPLVSILIGIGFIFVMVILMCAVIAVIKQGLFLSGLQIFWFVFSLFSVWAIGAIDYTVFVIGLFSAIAHFFLLAAYNNKFAME